MSSEFFKLLDDEECVECDAILEQLENIDDEADEFGINFVKNKDPHAARQAAGSNRTHTHHFVFIVK